MTPTDILLHLYSWIASFSWVLFITTPFVAGLWYSSGIFSQKHPLIQEVHSVANTLFNIVLINAIWVAPTFFLIEFIRSQV